MHDETVVHIVSECQKLAQKGYKNTNLDNMAKVIHWKLCEKWGFPRTQKWFMHKPKKTLQSEECKILRDFLINNWSIKY